MFKEMVDVLLLGPEYSSGLSNTGKTGHENTRKRQPIYCAYGRVWVVFFFVSVVHKIDRQTLS